MEVPHVDDLMEHPELIRTQFSQARKTADVELMISVMKALGADSPEHSPCCASVFNDQ